MTLEELLVKIKVENKQAVKGLDDAKKAAERAEDALKGVGNSKNVNLSGVRKLAKALKNVGTTLSGFNTVAKLDAGFIKPTKRAVELQKQLEETQSEMVTLKNLMDKIDKEGLSSADAKEKYEGYRRRINDLQELEAELKKAQVEAYRTGEAFERTEKPRSNIGMARAYVREAASMARGAVSGFAEQTASMFTKLEPINNFVRGVRRAGRGVKNFAVGAVNDFKSVLHGVVRLGRGFGTVLSKIPLLNKIPSIFKRMKKGMFMGAGLRSMIRLGATGFLIFKAFSMAREGMQNLAQYSGQTNSDLSMLMGSLNTLKNALATAFAPILTTVAPALNHLIQLLVKAATAVAHFTAAFTGKSTVVVAKQQTADYAAGMSDAADATGSANKAAKEYQKTLLGFDQMNILNKEDKSSGAGAGGGASGGGGLDPADMFETVDVSNGAKSLVEKIKDSWKDADFTDIGRDIGNKIGNMLDKIPWESLKETAYKLGKSVATGFNGLNDSALWTSIGKALGESVNTVVSGIKGFVENFKWAEAGKSFAGGVNKFFNTVNWKDIGSTVSKGVGGILDTITGFFNEVDWEKVGADFVDVIKAVHWGELIVKGIKAAGSIANGVLSFLKGAFEEAFSAVAEWIKSGDAWKDIKSIGKTVIDVGVNLVGDAWETIKTAVKGIWDVVKAIASHFKVDVPKAEVPENNPAQYQGHDYQGVDMSQTVTVDGKATEGFKTLYSQFKEIKDSKAVKTGGGTRTDGFKKLHAQFKEIKNNKAVKTAGGTRTDGFKKVHKQFKEVKNNTATKSLAGQLYRSFTDAKSKYDSVKAKTVTVSIQGLVANKLKKAVISFMADGGLYKNGHWQPITAAANGGAFNTGQMFIAREAGPELVGKIGGGTGVMNNDQIVSSVAKGVYEAVLSAMSMSEGDKSVNVYLMGDANKMFRVVQKEAVQYLNTTGQAPFPA